VFKQTNNQPQPAVKRFFKVLVLLVVGLFILMSGVDVTLDHLTRSLSQSSYTFYGDRGEVLASFTGDLALCPIGIRPGAPSQPNYLRRTSGAATSSPAVLSRSGNGWL
jgi:hypothetical protein